MVENLLEGFIESYGGIRRTPFPIGSCCLFCDMNFYTRNLALKQDASVENFGSQFDDPMVVLVCTVEGIEIMQYELMQY